MLRKILLFFHRITGVITALLLSMWFITGLVLVYHPFPNASKEEKYDKMESLNHTSPLPDIMDIAALVPDTVKISLAYINKRDSNVVINIHYNKKHIQIDAATLRPVTEINNTQLRNIASKWSSGSISSIDTLHERELWIMYNRYVNEMPIYKVYFDDAEKHQLYISSRTGEVQQFTGQSNRTWALLGSIPHKLYIPALRADSKLWANTITTLAVICLIAAITGVYAGLRITIKNYKKSKSIASPYRKQWYKWHHVAGLIFGLFVISWSISGTMSVKKIPQWIVKSHRKVPTNISGRTIMPESYRLTVNHITNNIDSVKSIEWKRFQKRPVIEVVSGSKTLYFDGASRTITELNLDPTEVKNAISKIHKEDSVKVELLAEADNYYMAWNRELPLPVYKVSVDDEDNSTYYVNPKSGNFRYVSDNRRAKRWLFHILHYFNHKWLVDRPVLWTIILWTTALGCTAVSVTGVYISWKYIKRKLIKPRKEVKSC